VAVAKKAVAKKAVAKKKVTAKKAVAKKAVAKKVVAKKAVAKKAVAKKKVTSKKAVAKKAVAKKKTAVKKTAVKKTAVKKTAVKKAAVVKKTALASFPVTPAPTPLLAVESDTARSGASKKVVALAAVAILGIGGTWIASNEGLFSKKDNEVIAVAETTAPTPKPVVTETPQPVVTETPKPVVSPTPKPVVTKAPKPVTASSTYTETGIRLAWRVKDIDVESISVSTAEGKKEFSEIATLASDIRFFDFIKTDTVGITKFKVTITSRNGEVFSSTIQLRGRFTVES